MADKILIICPGHRSTFVRLDAETLSSLYPIEVLGIDQFSRPKIITVPIVILGKFLRERIVAVVMWFSVPHLAPFIVILSKLFRKKIFVFTGGYDIAFVPEIRWGEMQSGWKRFLQRFALNHVDRVFTFSDFSKKDAAKYSHTVPTTTLYQGVDTTWFKPGREKRMMVITTCVEINTSTIIQKGIESVVESARRLPQYEFVVIGQVVAHDRIAENLVSSAPQNVTFTQRYISDEKLLRYYQQAKVYVQVSAHEGFGIACAEAMACMCVPVGTFNTSLPEVIGDTGFLVKFADLDATVEAIEKAMASTSLGTRARQRVVKLFDMRIRSERLKSEFLKLLQSKF